MSEAESVTEPVVTDSFYKPRQILGHADGIVVRATVDGKDVDVLVDGVHRIELLTALSHSLTDLEIKQFRELLGRQGR